MDPTLLLQEPLDIVRVSLDERVTIKCRGDREVVGKLHAYDMHLNMVLGDVEEVATTVTSDPLTGDEQTKKTTRRLPLIFLRGDAIILVAPVNRNKS
ncbi:LSM3, U6 small nuclear RNA associated isoform 2 family protein [Toxoplasma gondii TgCatPRC2]|uniref:LSM3, U6 small nuclear RNA associated isoform 2 family protein n=15 Tax=Toxoplasma gondii TaxID=5811 RepID=B9Q354_TOXGV|nr:LSM3, U6 small nuclear RNA associated isoform 2 family protein [Toxoplasma gondii ME49]EPR58950.1 LSM3, U6 small nuclear RNA associated isoform 2 family protein [Toxoplasma gondii GT1]ESS30471.1 LSM3, U6 small nuclear RNA associated isoform 2 family protein [Toxoplasma gondii VEG]KAF4645195.1 LSM3, U6 small nuclear RNA associated isoform 2 family protein [Toxoplasma gondii]KFG35244.1 LSM3, U6 small nuclear RNA associated isoform 2 family protein [Toxoplasma gondii GAB2-2007-GAL-DOM2]KFG4644|eukprot:XP_008885155.1 LSM3, U6 small nuclear RNA associated isoform 2 family protein [Hammondia hammondi]